MIQDFSLSGAFRDGPIFWSVRQGALNGTIFYVNFVLGLSGNGQHALSCDYAETRHQFWMLGREKDFCSILFSSVQSLSRVQLFATPWVAARLASLSITSSWSSPKLMSIESVIPSSHLILCHPLLLLPPIPPSIRVFSNESTLRIRWPKYWSFSFSISPSNEHPGLISFRMEWLDLLAVQGNLKSLL